jgi:glycosyltransferase involved in cell wall biosynthesis
MDISIILCTFNRCESLDNVLGCFSKMRFDQDTSWELLVVDNNSSDRTKIIVDQAIERGQKNIRYLFEGSQGKSFALNCGIAAAKGEIIAFTDDDVAVHPHWVAELKKIFSEFDCMGAGGRIIPTFRNNPPSWLRVDVPYPFMNVLVSFDFGKKPCALKQTPFGANMAFRKNAFDRYGLFRTDLGPTKENIFRRGEDSEFSARLLAAGETVMYAPEAIVYHPVEEERMKKGYFKAWYFNAGRCTALRNPPPAWTVHCLGVPRYLFRQLIAKLLKWLLTFDVQRRFCNKLEAYQVAGEIFEASRKCRLPTDVAYQ